MNEKVFTSEGQLKVGDKGENLILDFLKKYYDDVIILRGNEYRHFRRYDIDYVCSKNGKIENDILLRGDLTEIHKLYDTYELKSDTYMHKSGNIFAEEYMIRDRDGLRIEGYLNKCKAKFFLYYDVVRNILYGGKFGDFKIYFNENKEKFEKPYKPIQTELVGTKERAKVYGYKVPLSEVLERNVMHKVEAF